MTEQSPVAARRRQELKYAHLSRRDSEVRKANREALVDHIAELTDGFGQSR